MGLKIGLLNDTFPPVIDGVANAVKSYADILLANGDEPMVITPKYPKISDKYNYRVYRYSSIPTDKLFGYRAGNAYSPIAISDLYAEKFDLLHVHCPFASALLANSLKTFYKKELPIVFTYHTKFDIDIESRINIHGIQYLARQFVINNINKADEVWVVSNGAGENLRSLGYNGDYIIMPNGTDFAKGVSDISKVKIIRNQYGINNDCPVFLYVGRMFWYKNIGLSLEALKKLQGDGVKFKFILIGDGDDRPAIEAYTKELGISDSVIFTGQIFDREKLHDFYSLADLFLFPSTYDTSGLVVKEAAACNCPSLIIRGSSAAEGVEDGKSGYLCEESAEDIYSTVKNAINDCSHLVQVGENAGKYIYYSWEASVRAARLRYDEVLYNHKGKRKSGFRL